MVRSVRAPSFLYGTAWKENDTRRLVRLALDAGFRGIDTANQRKHYHEVGVGEALAEAIAAGTVTRDAVFLQTKFTHIGGQDQRLPYDADAPVAKQVEQSFASSLEHLRVATIDSYVLHGPSFRDGLAPEDIEAWQAMEAIHASGRARLLGVSNVSRGQLEELCSRSKEPPAFVQNRCYARTGWDRGVRSFCRERGIVYQGFSLLTANREEVASAAMKKIAARAKLTPSQVVFRFALEVGMLPLTGTKSPEHMREDLAVHEHALTEDEVRRVEAIGT
jgi:diketogulonate reductase-like aldo/keto reductase